MVYPEKKRYYDRGYVYVYFPEHPSVKARPYVAEHTLVMEAHLGRLLKKDEVVHHKDGNRANNELSNLEVLTKSSHARMHGFEKDRVLVPLICAHCGKHITKRVSNVRTHIKNGQVHFFCDRKCMGHCSQGNPKLYSITEDTLAVLNCNPKVKSSNLFAGSNKWRIS